MKFSPLVGAMALFAASLPIGSIANASTSTPQKIYNVTITTSGYAFFFLEGGDRAGTPACAAAFKSRWVFNTNTAAGQAVLSTLLTAYASGKAIGVNGNGACDVAGDTESVTYLYILDH